MNKTLFISLVCFTALVHAENLSKKIQQDKVEEMQDETPAMQRAFNKAKAGRDMFLSMAKSHPQNFVGFSVKIGLKQGSYTEYVWIIDFSEQGDGLVGELNSEPEVVKSAKLGQKIRFKKEQIVDWLYIDQAKGKMVGNYTMCALLTEQPAAEANALKRQYNLDCTGI